MAASIQERSGKFQLRVTHKLLPRPFFFTFDARDAAESYRDQLQALLARGIVPESMLTKPKTQEDPMLTVVIEDYQRETSVSDSDAGLFKVLKPELVGVRVSGVTFTWSENYVRSLKAPKVHLAPGTIRKRVGALARVLDWHIKRTTVDGDTPRANPLRMLTRGYSVYSKADAEEAGARHDVARDRRLSAQENTQVLQVLAGHKREDRERPFITEPADQFPMLYALIVDTGLRLFEAYRLRVESIDFTRNVLNVEGSKGHRGKIKPRVVPLKKHLREPLRAITAGRTGFVFDFWDGSLEDKKRAQLRLTSRFRNLFAYAGVPECTEHDLRHEAACRWFTLKTDKGWVFSELEICKIMGWSDPRMALRYLSLRGEDLSARLD
jgi:integrase